MSFALSRQIPPLARYRTRYSPRRDDLAGMVESYGKCTLRVAREGADLPARLDVPRAQDPVIGRSSDMSLHLSVRVTLRCSAAYVVVGLPAHAVDVFSSTAESLEEFPFGR